MSFPLWDMAFIIVITMAQAMWFFAMVSLLASIVTSMNTTKLMVRIMGFVIRIMMVQVVANAMHANLAQAFQMILQKVGPLK